MRYEKYVRNVFIILLLFILIANEGIVVLAMDTGFSTEALSENDKDKFLKNACITILNEEPQRKTTECFDVNEDGLIAIGSSKSDNKTICIYTDDGVFLYGYSFDCSGTFGVEWYDNGINIYFVRSSVAVAVNSKGEVEDIKEIQNTLENNSYWNNSVFSTKRVVGDTEYILKNDMGILNVFASSYSKLIATKTNQESNVIYDVSANHLLSIIVILIGVFAFVGIAVLCVKREFVKLKKNT